jgi:group I intron endonuclease
MKTKSGIYCIKNIVNGKKYIGSSIDVYKRRNRHFSELKNQKHKNIKLQYSYDKHGKDNFIFIVIELVEEKDELIVMEQYYINNEKPEYNINLIANSSLGVKRSEETKEKIRQANMGLKHPDWRNKIKSEAQGGDKHWTKSKDFSEESKTKMSESQKKLYENGYISPVKKTVLQYSTDMVFIKEWESGAEIERVLGIKRSSVSQCVKGVIKTSGGFIWKYKNKDYE